MNKLLNYYYKGYDITSKSRLEKMEMEYLNPYGYNFDSNEKRIVDKDFLVSHPNQNNVKNGEYMGKR